MNTGDDFADARLHARLFPEICDILAAFSNDDSSIFGTDESTESESLLRIWGGRARTVVYAFCVQKEGDSV